MKLRSLLAMVFVIALPVACVSPMYSASPVALLGSPAPPSAAVRTIVITPDTKWVNVTGGEVVRFIVGDKTFAWNFDVGEAIWSFDLNQVAPPGLLSREVIAYVAPNPLYFGDGAHGRHGGGHGGWRK